jgi:nucleoside-diphosphate-sugar epimerase
MVALGRELFDYKGKIVLGKSTDADYLVDNPNRRAPIIAKACTELGYAPAVSLEEGLYRSLLWYGENRTAEEA